MLLLTISQTNASTLVILVLLLLVFAACMDWHDDFFQGTDPKRYACRAEEPVMEIKGSSAAALRNTAGSLKLKEAQASGEAMNNRGGSHWKWRQTP